MCSVVGISREEDEMEAGFSLSESFAVDVRVWVVVVSEVLLANQDSSFMECFPPALLKLADAKHALAHKNARTRLPSKTHCVSGSTAFHNYF